MRKDMRGVSALKRIRLQSGMSVQETIKIHASQGYSKSFICELYGIKDPRTLNRICDRFNLHDEFRPQHKMNEACKGGGGQNKKYLNRVDSV